MVGLGIVGAGEVAARHVAAAASVPGVRVVAVSDVDAARAGRFGAPVVGLDALLAHPEVDVVVLAVPHALHADLALRACAAGRHVLVEKPLATGVTDCDRMIAAFEGAGLVLWVGQQQRHFAQVRAARSLLRSGALGAPLLYSERRSNDYTVGSRPAWFFDPALAGGGVAMLVGIHTIDRASWLLGARPVAVAATTATPSGFAIETDAAGILHLSGGAPPAHFVWTRDPAFFHETVVVCESGVLRLDPSGLTVVTGGTAERVVEVDGDREYTLSFARQYEALVRTLEHGDPPAVTPAEGRDAVAAVAALYESARSGGAPVPVR
jgi:predicted dehydrogenase